MSNATHTFWMCFQHALANNNKTPNGKRRILSIISNEFTYEELKRNLNVIFFIFLFYAYRNVNVQVFRIIFLFFKIMQIKKKKLRILQSYYQYNNNKSDFYNKYI
jgi:hypothetical protein